MLSVVLLFALLATCNGVTKVWTSSIGNSWENPLNWSPQGVPSSSDDVIISTTTNITINSDVSVRSLFINGTICSTVALFNCTFQASNGIEIDDGGAIFMKDSVIVSPITNVRGNIAISGLILGNLNADTSSVVEIHEFKNDSLSSNYADVTISGSFNINGFLLLDLGENKNDHINVDSLYLGNESSLLLFLHSSFSSNTIQLIDANKANGSFSSVLLISTDSRSLALSICRIRMPSTANIGFNTNSPSFSGTCSNSATNGYGVLIDTSNRFCCSVGWTGTKCNIPDCPGNPDCNDRGSCIVDSGNPVCQCVIGWSGNASDCPGSPDCNRHGNCTVGNSAPFCTCWNGWNGTDCSVAYCPNECSGHGNCRNDVMIPICDCFQGFQGINCSAPNACANNCSSRGNCNNGTCICNADWTGNDCSIPLCLGSTNCNFHGTCTPGATGNTCICQPGWSGSLCSVASCPNDCSDKGVCNIEASTPTCDCIYPNIGLDCSQVETNDNKSEGISSNQIIIIATTAGVILVAVTVTVIVMWHKKNRRSKSMGTFNAMALNSESATPK